MKNLLIDSKYFESINNNDYIDMLKVYQDGYVLLFWEYIYNTNQNILEIIKFLELNGIVILEDDIQLELTWICCLKNELETLKYLLDNYKDKLLPRTKATALEDACTYDNLDYIKLLLENNTQITYSAFALAASREHLDIFDYLLEQGMNINMYNCNILEWAVRLGSNISTIEHFIKKGANINLCIDNIIEHINTDNYEHTHIKKWISEKYGKKCYKL